MPFLEELQGELEEITTLKFISAAYTEASAAKIIKIRKNFERNTSYFQEVSDVYHIVKVSAELNRVKDKKSLARNDKILSIAITSNQRFYGNLNINTIRGLIDGGESIDTDNLVIGQTGIDYLHLSRFSKPFEQLIFEDDLPNQQDIKNLTEKMKPYSKVLVYYPKFQNMLRQVVDVTDITRTPESSEIGEKEIIKHIFEPEITYMLDFFETQVRTVLFTRAMLEADLSRTAARLLAMSGAEDRANEVIQEKKVEIAKIKRSVQNAQLLDTFTGIKQWKRK